MHFVTLQIDCVCNVVISAKRINQPLKVMASFRQLSPLPQDLVLPVRQAKALALMLVRRTVAMASAWHLLNQSLMANLARARYLMMQLVPARRSLAHHLILRRPPTEVRERSGWRRQVQAAALLTTTSRKVPVPMWVTG